MVSKVYVKRIFHRPPPKIQTSWWTVEYNWLFEGCTFVTHIKTFYVYANCVLIIRISSKTLYNREYMTKTHLRTSGTHTDFVSGTKLSFCIIKLFTALLAATGHTRHHSTHIGLRWALFYVDSLGEMNTFHASRHTRMPHLHRVCWQRVYTLPTLRTPDCAPSARIFTSLAHYYNRSSKQPTVLHTKTPATSIDSQLEIMNERSFCRRSTHTYTIIVMQWIYHIHISLATHMLDYCYTNQQKKRIFCHYTNPTYVLWLVLWCRGDPPHARMFTLAYKLSAQLHAFVRPTRRSEYITGIMRPCIPIQTT